MLRARTRRQRSRAWKADQVRQVRAQILMIRRRGRRKPQPKRQPNQHKGVGRRKALTKDLTQAPVEHLRVLMAWVRVHRRVLLAHPRRRSEGTENKSICWVLENGWSRTITWMKISLLVGKLRVKNRLDKPEKMRSEKEGKSSKRRTSKNTKMRYGLRMSNPSLKMNIQGW